MQEHKNILKTFPSPEKLREVNAGKPVHSELVANSHIHTPYSFSAFSNIDQIFTLAAKEKVNVLGINDFYVTDGYEPFYNGCVENNIFPLFNIEFIGLMKEEQQAGIRINDPNNPGRIYFCGKGLDYPVHHSEKLFSKLEAVKKETQRQLRAMTDKLNLLTGNNYPQLSLDFDTIKARFARELVRERHIARALRILAVESFAEPAERTVFIESLYGGKKSKSGWDNDAALENEIRSNILKAGGTAFVEEDESSFLEVADLVEIIKDAGGIPCYPVLLDDPSGRFTEFESDPERLFASLKKLGVGALELIPGRNKKHILEPFVKFFDEKGFVITFGTEHNTPEMSPLRVTASGNEDPGNYLTGVALKGVCVIAAHQYLRARGEEGYIYNGIPRYGEKSHFEALGRDVIEYFLSSR